jgi:spore coat protein SA
MVYHLLDESEPFSEHKGGAIQRIVANLIRGDENSKVVCASADGSWNHPESQILQLSSLRGRARWRGNLHYPAMMQKTLYKGWLEPLERVLQSGDVVWVHNRPDLITVLSPAAQRTGTKLILHMHNSFSPYRTTSSHFRIFSAVEKIVFVSRFLEREARDRFVTLGHTVVMHNGADANLYYPAEKRSEPEVPSVIFVGRIVPVKGAHVLVEAMRLLKARGVKLNARIVGASFFGGAVAPYLRKLRDNAPDNVTFDGYATGMALADKYREADFAVCPSIWNDAFPTVNLEAMGCGLACVATTVGGIPEQFAEGGALMVPKDNAVALAEALEKLATNPGLRAELARASCLNFEKNFTWQVAGERYQAILRSI